MYLFFGKFRRFRLPSILATDVTRCRGNTKDSGMTATLTLVSTPGCSVAILHLLENKASGKLENAESTSSLEPKMYCRLLNRDVMSESQLLGDQFQKHIKTNSTEELTCWLIIVASDRKQELQLNFKLKKRASVQHATSAAQWLPMVLGHQGYQLKSTATPLWGTPYVSRCAVVLNGDSTCCCAQLLSCVSSLQESSSHMAWCGGVEWRPRQTKSRQIVNSSIQDIDDLYKVASYFQCSSMDQWEDVIVKKEDFGEHGHQPWLHLLFGVLPPPSCQLEVKARLDLLAHFDSQRNKLSDTLESRSVLAAPTPPAGAGSSISSCRTHIYHGVHLKPVTLHLCAQMLSWRGGIHAIIRESLLSVSHTQPCSAGKQLNFSLPPATTLPNKPSAPVPASASQTSRGNPCLCVFFSPFPCACLCRSMHVDGDRWSRDLRGKTPRAITDALG